MGARPFRVLVPLCCANAVLLQSQIHGADNSGRNYSVLAVSSCGERRCIVNAALVILEGPECRDGLPMTDGNGRIQKTILKNAGLRWYQFVSRKKVNTTFCHPSAIQKLCAQMPVDFRAAGTWEDESKPVPPDSMPVPSQKTLAELWPHTEWQSQLSESGVAA